MNQTIQKLMSGNDLLTTIVLGFLSCVSAYFTYQGAVLVLDKETVHAGLNISALIFSSGVSAGLFLFWRYAHAILPVMLTGKTRSVGMAIVGLGCLFIMCLSSYMNVMSLAGSGALEAQMRAALQTYDSALTKAYSQATRIGELVSDLDLAAKRYDDLAQSEIKRGAVTGAAGAGGVSDSLLATKKTFGDLATSVRANLKKLARLQDEGRAVLARMGAAITGTGSIEERRAAFTKEAAALAKLISELGSNNLTSVIARSMRSLKGNTGLFSTSLKNGRLAKAQQDALQRINDDIAKTGESIATAAETLGNAKRVEVTAFKRIGLTKAVVIYALDLIPYWAGGIALDLMPVVLILLLMLLSYATDGRNTTDPDVDGMSFGQVRKVVYALKEMEMAGAPGRAASQVQNIAMAQAETKTLPAAAPTVDDQAEVHSRLSQQDEAEWEQHIRG